MKLSLKHRDDQHHNNNDNLNPLITAKIPISILNHPFLTSISTNSLSSDLSFSLSSNFSSGPSLKLSYAPTSKATAQTQPPISLSLKSGLGFFGSPDRSPLVFKAHFSLSSQNPAFSLHFKPQFGNFALKKTALSNQGTGSDSEPIKALNLGSASVENGCLRDGSSSIWQDVKLEPCGNGVDGFSGPKEAEGSGLFTGIALMARTVFPVRKNLVVNMRWGVNLPSDLGGTKMPYLTVNKIGIERVEPEPEPEPEAGNKAIIESVSGDSDSEKLKGLCAWMSRDLEVIQRENREMKWSLAEMKRLGVPPRNDSPPPKPSMGSVGPKATPGESSGDFEGWKKRKKSGKEDKSAKREVKKPSDLEAELQRAIEAASVAGS